MDLAHGNWGIDSGWKTISEKDSEAMICTALDNGINFFDTAPNYGNGTSESRLGNVFKNIDRSKIVVNTKFGRLDNGTVDFDSKHIISSIEKSLSRLNIDYLDSVIIHSPPIELLDGNKNDHYEILEKLQDQGKIIAYGASIDFYDEIKILLDTTNAKVLQPLFNILHQDAKKAFALTKQNNVAVIAKIPLDSGWLTGKYDSNSHFTGVRSRWTQEEKLQRSKLVDRVKEIVGEKHSLVTSALSFCTSFEEVSTVIPGAISKQQLIHNIEAMRNPIAESTRNELVSFYENEVEKLNLPW